MRRRPCAEVLRVHADGAKPDDVEAGFGPFTAPDGARRYIGCLPPAQETRACIGLSRRETARRRKSLARGAALCLCLFLIKWRPFGLGRGFLIPGWRGRPGVEYSCEGEAGVADFPSALSGAHGPG